MCERNTKTLINPLSRFIGCEHLAPFDFSSSHSTYQYYLFSNPLESEWEMTLLFACILYDGTLNQSMESLQILPVLQKSSFKEFFLCSPGRNSWKGIVFRRLPLWPLIYRTSPASLCAEGNRQYWSIQVNYFILHPSIWIGLKFPFDYPHALTEKPRWLPFLFT